MTGGVLQGIRVIDLSSVVVGPVATMFLADYGAEVIKIEPPNGDLLRRLGGPSNSSQLSPKFLHLNRNKKSLCIDLKSANGMTVLRKLLKTADICVSNMRPKAMRRLKLAPSDLKEINADLIYCGIVGFGQNGRYRDKPAYDTIIQGMSGLSGIFERTGCEPRFVPMTMADHTVGLIAAQMILLGLYSRQVTGIAKNIEVPMFENMAAFVLSEHMGQLSFVPPRGEPGDARVLDPNAKPIPTKDGYICVSANTDAQTHAFFEAIDRPELCKHPKFRSVAARLENVREYFAIREKALLSKTSAEWLAIFDEVDVPAGPSHTIQSLIEDEHLRETAFLRSEHHPAEGQILDLSLANKAEGFSRTNFSCAPLIGEHSRDILLNLGYSPSQIRQMIEDGELRESEFVAGTKSATTT